jgi:hypothetical protein
LETGTIFGIAVEAARDIKAAPRIGGQRSALISVVFSVIALEAFVNEMTEHAQQMSAYQPMVEGPEVILFAQVMGDAEEAHTRLESKLTLANWILSGRNVDRGSQPYQDLVLLMRLRNDLVHTKPNRLFVYGTTTNEEAHRELMVKFRDKNILANDKDTGSWTYLAQTKAVAEWSCRTAAHVVNDLCSGATQSNFQTVLIFVNDVFQSHVATLM